MASFLDSFDSDSRTIAEASLSERITVLVGRVTNAGLQTSCATYQTSDAGKASRVSRDDGGLLYRQASLFKVFISVAMGLIINRLSEDPKAEKEDKGSKYSRLRKVWDESFSDVFNRVSEGLKIGPLPGDPSVRNVLTHFNGFPNINDELFAADGSFLMSMDDFIKKSISRHINNPKWRQHHQSRSDYSNGNFILIAMLIRVASGMSLSKFLKTRVFEPLQMNRTYVTLEDFQKLSNPTYRHKRKVAIAQPHVVRSDGTRYEIEIIHPKDMAELVVLGGYISAGDMELFFRELISGLPGLFGENFPHFLYDGKNTFQTDHPDGYKLLGLLARFDSTWPGSHSLDRLTSPDGDCSKSKLGIPPSGKELMAYYLAGTATGTSHTVYFLPDEQVTVIVLTNTTGILDASDLISRLCLQKLFDLPESGIRHRKLIPRLKAWITNLRMRGRVADKPNPASEWLKENLPAVKKLEDEDSAPDTHTAECPEVLGTYVNDSSGLTLEVSDSAGDGSGVLRATLSAWSKGSQPMRFPRIKKEKSLGPLKVDKKDRVFRMCSLAQERSLGVSIERHGAWKNAEFEFCKNGEKSWFSRDGDSHLDEFVRENEIRPTSIDIMEPVNWGEGVDFDEM